MFDKLGKSIGKAIVKEVMKGPLSRIPPNAPTLIPKNPIGELFDSPHRKRETIFDVFKENVEPGIGALVYCELFKMEHSGIYLGNNRIAQLSGKGTIEAVSPKRFTDNITTVDKDIFIPVNSFGEPITYYEAAQNAEGIIGGTRFYNMILDNCHQFSSGCITGNFENNDNFLVFTKDTFYSAVQKKGEVATLEVE